MSFELCRLCLSREHLKPIFPDIEQSEKYSSVLALTTGLSIQLNDGLPQKICGACTDAVNNFLNFRNQAQISENELLLNLGFKHIEPSKDEENKVETNNTDGISTTDCYNFDRFKIEVELDRISQNGEENEEIVEFADLRYSQPEKKNGKDTKQMYLSLADGEYVHNRPIKCKICRKSLKKWKSFVNHAKKHLATENEIDLDTTKQGGDEIKDPTEDLTDPIDTETVKNKKKSRKEMRQLYLSYVEGELVPNGPVKCKICKKTLNKWNSFINHARKHLGFKIVCEFCGKSFVSSNQLKRHCRSFHGMERDLKCKHCNYLALDTAQLRVHERRVHTGERPFVCDTCAASYFSRKCLLQHIESHRTVASVQCDKCPMTFKSRRHLAKHVYGTHSDKRRERRRERRQAIINKDAV